MKSIVLITDCPYKSWQVKTFNQFVQPLNPRRFQLFPTALQPKVLKMMKMAGRKACPKGYILDENARAVPYSEYTRAKKKFDELLKIYSPDDAILVPCGEFALYLCTGEVAIKEYHGSMMKCGGFDVLPFLPPDRLQVQYGWRDFMKADRARLHGMRQGKIVPPEFPNCITDADLDDVAEAVNVFAARSTENRLVCDIETSDGEIDCIGLGYEEADGEFKVLVVPFRDGHKNLWSHDTEVELVRLILSLLKLTDVFIGQNFSYDLAWLFERWGFFPGPKQTIFDTMAAGHVLSPQQEKSLDSLAALYLASYSYWKTDHKGWKYEEGGLAKRMVYNAKDIHYTYRLYDVLSRRLEEEGLYHAHEFQGRSIKTLHRMTRFGSHVDEDYARKVGDWVNDELKRLDSYIRTATGLKYSQAKALGELFYDQLGLPEIKNRKTKKRTFDKAAVEKLAEKHPEYGPVLNRLRRVRSVKIFRDNLNFQRAPNGRYYCGYNESGTDTFRLSSNSDPFGYGVNGQNLTKGTKDGSVPNMRGMFVADPGFTGYECDLKQADAQVVAADSGCARILSIFREGLDLHDENAKEVYGPSIVNHPQFQDVYRPRTKAGVHATNYGAHESTLAKTLGITVKEAGEFKRKWFGANPEILEWQKRRIRELETTRQLVNPFGFRVVYLGEMNFHAHAFALAWVPQSTVALLTQKVAVAWEEQLDHDIFRTQFQTHDSLRFLLREGQDNYLERAKAIAAAIPVPYPTPLYIGWDYEKCPRWGQKQREDEDVELV